MKIFLTGFMGCGKSRKGRELAAHLNWPFIDIDHELVAQTGLSITTYFSTFGEAAFRDLESKLLKELKYPENCVVAVGGGMPCFFDNMDWMNQNGTTIYLKMEPAALVSRLHNRNKRPLIKDMNDAQLLAFIEKKLAERESFYNQAAIVVNGLNLHTYELVKALEK